jgi:hypothetical protein
MRGCITVLAMIVLLTPQEKARKRNQMMLRGANSDLGGGPLTRSMLGEGVWTAAYLGIIQHLTTTSLLTLTPW